MPNIAPLKVNISPNAVKTEGAISPIGSAKKPKNKKLLVFVGRLEDHSKKVSRAINLIKEIDSKFHVTLDQTAFFPGGGGQCGDLGFIENNKIFFKLKP